ncbi:PREDICTED: formin-like protein 20 [Hipposideros armiger]|uniref:Formin-like protein 20 n=1 Tax=Hipposideros armiger TaxID=186990 RepID=A0A8B7QIJ7_HIPAR|nr:PREDICTED: formin-like protein 20 [Hipposideros armiger]
MSEEPPRRLPSMLGSAASPTALGGGHSARPGSPPSPPGASSSQPSPAPQSSPHATRVLRPPQHRLRLSPTQRQPPAPGQARNHTRAAIGYLGPDDVSVSLIRTAGAPPAWVGCCRATMCLTWPILAGGEPCAGGISSTPSTVHVCGLHP